MHGRLSVCVELQGEEYVADGTADLVSYGALFLANANLPALIATGKPIDYTSAWNVAVWYGRDPEDDEKGYTDWPLVDAVIESIKSGATAVKEAVVGA